VRRLRSKRVDLARVSVVAAVIVAVAAVIVLVVAAVAVADAAVKAETPTPTQTTMATINLSPEETVDVTRSAMRA
jgi:hypothetical protein